MTTTAAQATITEIFAAPHFTDELIAQLYAAEFGRIGSTLRDANGNLRDFTDEETAGRAALKAEYTKRGLGRA